MTRETDWLDALLSRRLLIHVGKGGVGRSAMTAAIAQLAASKGKRVLVCEVNAKERMSSLLGGKAPTSFDSLDEIWQPQERIWAVNIRPWSAMREYISDVLRMKAIFNIVFEKNAMRHFLQAIPGLQELVFIGKAWFHVEQTLKDGSPRFDLVIVDAPATGHGLAMLRIPQVIMDVVPVGPMRSKTELIRELLLDPERTWINLVTLPEEMPVNETIELHEKLVTMLGLPIGVAWMNQWPTAACKDEQLPLLEALQEVGLKAPATQPHFAAGQVAARTHKRARTHMETLQEQLDCPIFQIPRLAPVLQDQDEAAQPAAAFRERAVANGLAALIERAITATPS